jgi:DNA-binding response OmpR family regulator
MMDVQMPVMDGYEATRTVRENLGLKHLPIVGLTANAMASDRDRCLQAGMNEHLAKPFELIQLVAVIQRLVRGESGGDPIERDAAQATVTPHFAEQSTVEADIASALAKLGGMVPVYKRAATAFVNQLPDLRLTLLSALEDSNNAQLLGLLHT